MFNLAKLYSNGKPMQFGNFNFQTVEQASKECERKNTSLSWLGVETFRWVVVEIPSNKDQSQ